MNELQHLQRVILGIVKDIDKICQANIIQYYLLGGFMNWSDTSQKFYTMG